MMCIVYMFMSCYNGYNNNKNKEDNDIKIESSIKQSS